jgi:multidrug transporter EmrE-like cation transporter
VTMLPFILFTVLTNAAAQLMLKQGMLSLGALDGLAGNLVVKALSVVFNPWVFAGLVTFVVSMATHLYVLSKVELSFAHPFLSLAFVVVAVAAWAFWGENLNPLRIAGIALICCGTVLIAQGGEARAPAAVAAAKSGANS